MLDKKRILEGKITFSFLDQYFVTTTDQNLFVYLIAYLRHKVSYAIKFKIC